MFCKSCCADVDTYDIKRPDTPHESQLSCQICDTFLGWKKKEKNQNKRPSNKYKPEDLEINYCQLCLRGAEHLGKNIVLNIHHILEITPLVGVKGEDVKENCWVVCYPCHNFIHWMRKYMNKALENFDRGGNEQDT